MIPGEYIVEEGEMELTGKADRQAGREQQGRPARTGRLPLSFFRGEQGAFFDRKQAFAMRLDIPAGTAVRFEPGQEKEVALVGSGARKVVHGLNNLTDGPVEDASVRKRAIEAAGEKGFGGA